MCHKFATTGFCRYGDKCQFAHGAEELRAVVRHPKYKTEKCKTFWTRGHCPYGFRCRFLHDEVEGVDARSASSASPASMGDMSGGTWSTGGGSAGDAYTRRRSGSAPVPPVQGGGGSSSASGGGGQDRVAPLAAVNASLERFLEPSRRRTLSSPPSPSTAAGAAPIPGALGLSVVQHLAARAAGAMSPPGSLSGSSDASLASARSPGGSSLGQHRHAPPGPLDAPPPPPGVRGGMPPVYSPRTLSRPGAGAVSLMIETAGAYAVPAPPPGAGGGAYNQLRVPVSPTMLAAASAAPWMPRGAAEAHAYAAGADAAGAAAAAGFVGVGGPYSRSAAAAAAAAAAATAASHTSPYLTSALPPPARAPPTLLWAAGRARSWPRASGEAARAMFGARPPPELAAIDAAEAEEEGGDSTAAAAAAYRGGRVRGVSDPPPGFGATHAAAAAATAAAAGVRLAPAPSEHAPATTEAGAAAVAAAAERSSSGAGASPRMSLFPVFTDPTGSGSEVPGGALTWGSEPPAAAAGAWAAGPAARDGEHGMSDSDVDRRLAVFQRLLN
jgi:hypothetical protein